MEMNQAKRSVLIIALGVAFEYFDMMLVSLLASSIAQEFIGSVHLSLKLLYAYLGYAIAFIFRPLGAFCFGCIGDVYGRKTSLISSMVLMSTATLALAFIPSAEVAGIIATLLFLLCRIAQGLAVGGEYGTAMTYSYELNSKWRTFYGACVVSSTHLGGVFATLLASIYIDNFRLIFLVGGMVGFCLLLFRSFMKEYHELIPKKISQIAMESVKDRKAIVQAVVVASMVVLVFYGSLIYLNEFVHQELGVSRSQIFQVNSLLIGLWIVLPPSFGYLADQYGVSYREMMRVGATGVFLSAPLLGVALVLASYRVIVAAQIVLHLFHMLFCLCTPRFFGDLFAGSARNTSLSTSYSIGASFTAALAPMICHMSSTLFQTHFAICLPFMAIAMLANFILKKEKIYVHG